MHKNRKTWWVSPKSFVLQTMSMQAQILNGMYVFIYYFFQICLFIFMKNAVRKTECWVGAHLLGSFFFARRYMCFFFFFGGLLTNTRRRSRGFRCADSKNGNLQVLSRTGRSYYYERIVFGKDCRRISKCPIMYGTFRCSELLFRSRIVQ